MNSDSSALLARDLITYLCANFLVKIFDAETKKEQHHFVNVHKGLSHYIRLTLYPHLDWVWSLALSNDGKSIITGLKDGTIKILDLQTKALEASF